MGLQINDRSLNYQVVAVSVYGCLQSMRGVQHILGLLGSVNLHISGFGRRNDRNGALSTFQVRNAIGGILQRATGEHRRAVRCGSRKNHEADAW